MVAKNVFVENRLVSIVLAVIVLVFTSPEDTIAEVRELKFARVPNTVAAEIEDVIRRFTVKALTAARSVEIAFVFREVVPSCAAVIAEVDRDCVTVDSVRIFSDTVTVLNAISIGYIKLGGYTAPLIELTSKSVVLTVLAVSRDVESVFVCKEDVFRFVKSVLKLIDEAYTVPEDTVFVTSEFV